MDPSLESTSPGSSTRLPPRAFLRTDAPVLALGGSWAFRLHEHSPGDEDGEGIPPFAEPSFDDGPWERLLVPGHWVLQGHGSPIYTNIAYPFPLDPPHVPDENPTGDHRVTFEVPDGFARGGRAVLRFDGVESHARVWLNGRPVGWFTGSRLPTEFDVTAVLRPGANVLAVRVSQWSAASYLEDQDQWWLPGIFRDVSLVSRPRNGLEDVRVYADYDRSTGGGRLDLAVSGAFPVTVEIPELGTRATWETPAGVRPLDVGPVDPWSAESPRLYDVTVSSPGEQAHLCVGFRRIEIVAGRLVANGRPLTLRGVNRHETNPDLGRVFDEDFVMKDLCLMKRHNINAIRTCHQPPHPRTLELADELGFWVVLECDLETHGFSENDWSGNPGDDPAWRDALLDRIARTVCRDVNHPSIIMWSLGNESGTGRNLAEMADWVHRSDPTRPVHYEGDRGGAYTDVYSRMYPTLEEITSICADTPTMALHEAGPAEGARQRAKPFVLCEYGHAMGNGPGSLADYEELTDRFERHCGGFIWEWRDHGLRTRDDQGHEYFGFGGDFGEILHDGSFIMDGLVLSDGTPSPALAELAAVWAPVRLTLDGARLTVANRRHDSGIGDLLAHWVLQRDGLEAASGDIDLAGRAPAGDLAPGQTTEIDLESDPACAEALDAMRGDGPAAEWHLLVEARLADAVLWAPAGHVVARAQAALAERRAPSAFTGSPGLLGGDEGGGETGEDTAGVLARAVFSDTGSLLSWRGVRMVGPTPELWRAPTENDRATGQGSYELTDPALSDGRGDEDAASSAQLWREAGLDRLMHRVVSRQPASGGLVQRVRSMPAGQSHGVDSTFRWRADSDGLHLRVSVRPFGRWTCTWPRLGIRFDLPEGVGTETVSWWGTGPSESYPDSCDATWVGRFSSDIDALAVAYARPQETGFRPGLRELRLGGLDLATVEGAGGRPGFQLLRHSPQELSRADHAHELPDPGRRLCLILDIAQHGLGSRTCGPDVLPRYALWPRAASWEIVLR
jgi:beta-galactosidase